MIRASELTIDRLLPLGGMAGHASWQCGGDPGTLPPRKLAKIRKNLCANYSGTIASLPEDVAAWFAPSVSDIDLLAFLTACQTRLEQHWQKQEAEFNDAVSDFDEPVREALRLLADLHVWPADASSGRILVEDDPAFRQYLVLENAEGLPGTDAEFLLGDWALARDKENGGYRLELRMQDQRSGEEHTYTVTFSGAAVEPEPQDCTTILGIAGNPWDNLCAMAGCLCRKAAVSKTICNEAELDLLPLCREVAALGLWYRDAEDDPTAFPLLEAMLAPYPPKALGLLERLKAVGGDPRKRTDAAGTLLRWLCRKEYEPLWREIYEKIRVSQQPYRRPSGLSREIRAAIDAALLERGYRGDYPDYSKQGAIRGIRLAESYGMAYWIWNEKRVSHHIRCVELPDDFGNISMRFLCGTALLRKEDPPTDICGCMFDAGGRRFFQRLHTMQLPVRAAVLAAKKAELQKLTREERLLCHQNVFDWSLFWWIFLVGGGIFGVFMTLAMFALSAVMALIFGQPETIGDMAREIPWWHCLVFCWVSFGGLTGLVTALARRK